jgi:triosephosphate isomerase (TIM)
VSHTRKPLVAGNWKLYKNLRESVELATSVATAAANDASGHSVREVAVAPVFTALAKVADVLNGTAVALAAQDVFWETQGAFTGEVGPVQLADIGCKYVIVGHSERRQLFGETDDAVGRKAKAVLAHKMAPIVCVGETLQEREAGQAEAVVVRQLKAGLAGVSVQEAARVVIAYEPVWAIGTGRTAEPRDAQEMHARIRGTLASLWNGALAEQVRILYGGSVKPDNAAALMSETDIDGALVGGASLTIEAFSAIIAAAK